MSAAEEKPVSAAEEEKKLGNACFAKKEYDEAIKHYTKAIELDDSQAAFYSNRSACYASKKEWQAALGDALQCVSKDAKFVKGYLRLAVAQMELDMLEDADKTLRAALTLEPDNTLVGKQLKTLNAKKKAKSGVTAPKQKVLDEAQRKELYELTEQARSFKSDLNSVLMRMAAIERESKAAAVSYGQIEQFPEETPLYKGVGKCYMRHDRESIQKSLEEEVEANNKTVEDLKDRKEYIERRLQSANSNIKDLTTA